MVAKCRVFILFLAVLLFPFPVFSDEAYIELIPNGEVYGCLNCHPKKDYTQNPFGADFNVNNNVWDYPLATMDSDQDTYTNGEELQDPYGTWIEGDPPPGNVSIVTNPGCHKDECPASKILGNDSYNLNILRDFRKVICRTSKGRLYTKQYYCFSDDINDLLINDIHLKEEAKSLLLKSIPKIEAFVNGQEIQLSDKEKEEIIVFLNNLQICSSVPFSLFLDKVKKDIKNNTFLKQNINLLY
ncbi:MAG: hypothetical protein SV062_10470 [Thermodesulfobacteriota bacterium]|nr:hypothetical protein [Thermodesulfobacteriota bacterium]